MDSSANMATAVLLTNRMDNYTKDNHFKYFNEHLTEVLRLYNQKTGQEDYTDHRRYTADTSGKGFKQYQKDNWQILEVIEKLRTAYRFAQSKWR